MNRCSLENSKALHERNEASFRAERIGQADDNTDLMACRFYAFLSLFLRCKIFAG